MRYGPRHGNTHQTAAMPQTSGGVSEHLASKLASRELVSNSQLFLVKERNGDSKSAYFRRAKTWEAEPQYLKSAVQQLDKFYSGKRLFS